MSNDSEKTERTWLVDGESGIASSESTQEPLAGFDTNGGAALGLPHRFFLARQYPVREFAVFYQHSLVPAALIS